MARPRRLSRGITLPELLTTLAVLSVAGGLSASALHAFAGMTTLRSAAHEIATVFTEARSRAIYRGAYCGVQWVASDGDLTLQVFDDRDGDGVRTDDIRKGIDTPASAALSVRSRWPKVSVGFIPGFTARDPNGDPAGDLSDPIRFGRSDIASFSPFGDCSPGTIWLGDGARRQSIVRLTPGTARISVYEWAAARGKWIRAW